MKKSFLNKILRLVPKRLHSNILIIFILNLFGNILEIFGIGMLPILVLNIINPSYILSFALDNNIIFLQKIINNDNSTIYLLSFLLIFYLIKSVFLISTVYLQRKLGVKLLNYNRKIIFSKYLFCDYQTYLKSKPSKLISIINSELPSSCSLVEIILLILREFIFLLFIVVTIFIINPYVTFVTMLILFMFLYIYYLFVYKASKKRGELSLKNRLLNIKIINESFDLIKEIKIYSKANYFFKLFSQQIKQSEKQKIFNTVYTAIPKFALEICLLLVILLIILINDFIFDKNIDLIPVITFIAASSIRVIPAFRLLATSLNNFGFSRPSLELVISELEKEKQDINFASLEQDVSEKLESDKNLKIVFDKSIEFKNVSFEYLDKKKYKIISDLNFKIQKGEKIGIAGPSGSGKTTLLNLIIGLLIPTSGIILSDDKDINNKFNFWRKKIGYVPQDVHLINTTLKNNIAFGVDDKFINMDILNHTIHRAQLKDFLQTNNNDLDFLIDLKSSNISGGQRQRIGIARAIYNNPEILILDEATNSLDEDNEKKIISKLFEDKKITIFIVAHRISTLSGCDKLIYINEGKLIKIGSYDEVSKLIKK